MSSKPVDTKLSSREEVEVKAGPFQDVPMQCHCAIQSVGPAGTRLCSS